MIQDIPVADFRSDGQARSLQDAVAQIASWGAFVRVAMGSVVDDPAIRPSKHIFVGSRAPWFTITDDLPQYAAHAEAAAGGQAA